MTNALSPGADPIAGSTTPPFGGANPETPSGSWAGEIANGDYWINAYGSWVIALPQAPPGQMAYSSQWVGIGQGTVGPDYALVQIGSEDDTTDNISSHTVFLRWDVIFPGTPAPEQIVASASPGDTIWVHIFVPEGCGSPTMTIEDENIEFDGSYSYNRRSCSDGTAEWIYQRPTVNNQSPLLANAPFEFTDAEADGPGVTTAGIGTLPHTYKNMANCSIAPNAKLAYPGAISSDDKSFWEYWTASGSTSSTSGCTPWTY